MECGTENLELCKHDDFFFLCTKYLEKCNGACFIVGDLLRWHTERPCLEKLYYLRENAKFEPISNSWHLLSVVTARKINMNLSPLIIQRDATICSLFIAADCSSCFGWWCYPSSGAQLHSQHLVVVAVSELLPPAIMVYLTMTAGGSSTDTATSCMCSWWWVSSLPETCRAVCSNK
jgi:hypothetical protein